MTTLLRKAADSMHLPYFEHFGIDADLGQPWKGDAELVLGDSQWDELASILPVQKILGGYYREVGVTFAGGKLIADRSNPV